MMKLIKNTKLGINNFINLFLIFFIFFYFIPAKTTDDLDVNKKRFIILKILDKVSSKTTELRFEIGEEKKFKNLLIKTLRCKNSEFDDNPDVTAYIQVKDITYKNNNEVFVFNGWTFSSSPSLRPFDHPVYDIWLKSCN